MFALVLALIACMTPERWVDDFAVAVCEHRAQCGFGDDLDGEPCVEAYTRLNGGAAKECGTDSDAAMACLDAVEAMAESGECDDAGADDACEAYFAACAAAE